MAPMFLALRALDSNRVFNMVIAVIIDGFEEAKNIILHQKFDKNLNRAPFVMSRTKFWRNKLWLFFNEISLTICAKKKKKEKGGGKRGKKRKKNRGSKDSTSKNAENSDREGKGEINVKVHPANAAQDTVDGDEDQEVDHAGEGKADTQRKSGLKRSKTKKDIMISSLASFHNPHQVKMENLVEHVSTAKHTLRPAYHLKNL